MNKKTSAVIISFGLILILGVLGAFWLTRNEPSVNGQDDLVLFYSDTCPHCKIVEDFMTQNQIEKKVTLQKKEVSGNADNLNDLISANIKCGLGRDSVSVPLLAEGEKCYLGDQDIINFLKQKVNLQ